MKKKFFAIILSTLALFNLVSCGSSKSSKLKDGEYKIETAKADDHGNKAKLSIKVVKGEITEATYNEFNAENNQLKRDNEEYNKKMTEVSGIAPKDYEPQLEQALIKAQSADIDTITGATGSSEQFKSLANAILKNAEEGKTGESKLE